MDTSSATHVAITSFSDDDVESFKETDTFINSLHQQPKETQSKLRRPLLYIWGLSTIFLVLLCSLLLFQLQKLYTIASYENGFNTDFDPVKPIIGTVKQQFSGGLVLNEDGRWGRNSTTTPQYVGLPSVAIDNAWLDLLSAAQIVVSGDEAQSIKSETVEEREGRKYRLSLGVHYALHCVDLVRKAIDFDHYYPTGKTPYFYRDHVDDCIDYIRQSIQCQGDLTPITYYRRGPDIFPASGATHTCRNFDELNMWALERRALHLP